MMKLPSWRFSAPRMAVAAIVGVGLGVAAGLRLAEGDGLAPAASLVLGALLIPVVRWLAPPGVRDELGAVLALAFSLRATVAVIIYTASMAMGRGGGLGADDGGYVVLIWSYAQHIRGLEEPSIGPPYWGGYAFLFSTFVYLQSAIFAVFGFQPLIGVLVNAWLGTVAIALTWDMARRIFGRAPALGTGLVLAFSPGLLLYSAVMLKESVALVITSLVLWILTRFAERPRPVVLAVAYVVLELLHSVRGYVFLGLTMVLPIGVSAVRGIRAGSRVMWTAGAVGASIGIVAFNAALTGDPQLPSKPLLEFQRVRQAMATGRTAFVISTHAPTSVPTTVPTSAPTTAPVVLGDGRRTTVPTTRPTTAPTTVPTTIPTTVPLRQEAPPDAGEADVDAFRRTLSYLPTGIRYVLLAPFPWVAQRPQDWLVLPDTLLWYLVAAAAMWSAWLVRAQWRGYVALLAFAGGMLLVLALFEGNVGTLHRHRAVTVFPFAAVLAGPALVSLWRFSTRRGRKAGPARST